MMEAVPDFMKPEKGALGGQKVTSASVNCSGRLKLQTLLQLPELGALRRVLGSPSLDFADSGRGKEEVTF